MSHIHDTTICCFLNKKNIFTFKVYLNKEIIKNRHYIYVYTLNTTKHINHRSQLETYRIIIKNPSRKLSCYNNKMVTN